MDHCRCQWVRKEHRLRSIGDRRDHRIRLDHQSRSPHRPNPRSGRARSGSANLASVQRIEQWLYASVATHQTVGVETVLSTDKYRKLVSAAKERGFRFKLIYLVLSSAKLNVERVAERVAKGGHDVPRKKIIARRAASLRQLPWFMAKSDYALIVDNSGATPIDVVAWRPGEVDIRDRALPEIRSAVEQAIRLFQ